MGTMKFNRTTAIKQRGAGRARKAGAKRMVKIYGMSDDLIEIEGSDVVDEIGCFDRDALLVFSEGTIIRVHYGKPDLGVWSIMILRQGSARHLLTLCNDENADPYSDIFTIDAEVCFCTTIDTEAHDVFML